MVWLTGDKKSLIKRLKIDLEKQKQSCRWMRCNKIQEVMGQANHYSDDPVKCSYLFKIIKIIICIIFLFCTIFLKYIYFFIYYQYIMFYIEFYFYILFYIKFQIIWFSWHGKVIHGLHYFFFFFVIQKYILKLLRGHYLWFFFKSLFS